MIGWTYCSGILTAELAVPWVDWRLAAEIEAFPRELAERRRGYRCVRRRRRRGDNGPAMWHDFTTLRARHARRLGIPLPQILVAGTPCQAFSLAGLRRRLEDPRGRLTLEFVRHVRFLRSLGLRWLVWENVPGVLSAHESNPFGCFLGGIVGGDAPVPPPGGGSWPRAGMVSGPLGRACWRVLGAEHFGVPQRRDRVFVVAGLGDDADPAAVLFERQGMLGHSKARRAPRENLAAAAGASSRGKRDRGDPDGALVVEGAGGRAASGAGLARANARGAAAGRMILTNPEGATGFPYLTTSNLGKTVNNQTPLLAFSCKDHAADAGPLSPTIRSMEFAGSHANAGGQVAVAFDPTQITSATNRSDPRPGDPAPTFPARGHAPVATFKPSHYTRGKDGAPSGLCPPWSADADKGDQDPLLLDETVVRRITPREVERLFGLPDDWTLIPHGHARRDPVELAAQALYLAESGYSEADAWALADVPDGPRYRALGNAMALPVIAWVLDRIRQQEHSDAG